MHDAALPVLNEWGHEASVVHGMPNATYHAGPGLSHSGAKRIRKTPFHYHAPLGSIVPPKAPTPAMFNGTLTHCALLEPDEFDKRYVVAPKLNKNSNDWKAWLQSTTLAGLEPIDQFQRDLAHAQAAALRTLPEVAQLLARGDPEVSAYWYDPLTGVLCKCRPDWVSPWGHGKSVVLLDVKTTSDASPEQFARSCANFEYHAQAAWYCEGYALASGLEVHGMVFAVVESDYPHACAAYMLDDAALEKGREMNAEARAVYAQCERDDVWPSYPNTIQVLKLPAWALKEAA